MTTTSRLISFAFPSIRWILAPSLLLAFGACAPESGDTGSSASNTGGVEVPSSLGSIDPPASQISNLEVVEDLSEEVANRLIEWGDALRKRDFTSSASYLTGDFRGHDFSELGEANPTSLPLGIERNMISLDAPTVVKRDGFLVGLESFLSGYNAIDVVIPKLKGAEFAAGKGGGTATIRLTVLGRGNGGGPLGIVAWCRARVVEAGGSWRMKELQVTSLESLSRSRPLFTDVSLTAGVASRGPRFGKDGNTSFFWEGAAAYDADADGLVDIFVPSDERNFLYRNRGDGTFEEVAEDAGLSGVGGGTSALFFDANQDGATDLLVGQVGWEEHGDLIGHSNQFFRGGGDGTFTDASGASGLGQRHVTFGISAADVENDGDVDLYVASYNTEGFTAPNSWHEATNGTPNALYLNSGDGTFENLAGERGVADTRWSYAASFADYDEDGDQDLYVANDYASNALFQNDGAASFVDAAEKLGVTDVGNGMGVTWGDHDSDGDLDLYVANMSSTAGNRILKRLFSQGGSTIEKTLFKLAAGNSIFTWTGDSFEREPDELGGISASWAWATQFNDVDLDGDQDLLCVNGFISGQSLKDT